jgi:hypothetical protein
MKLDRLSSTTRHLSVEPRGERVPQAGDEAVLRVGAMQGVAADRQRSLQQELADFDPQAVDVFSGGALIMANAQELARQLALLGEAANTLIKTHAANLVQPPGVDTEA